MLDFCYFLCSTRPRVRCEPAICEKLRFLLRVPFLLSCLIFLFFLSFVFDCLFRFRFLGVELFVHSVFFLWISCGLLGFCGELCSVPHVPDTYVRGPHFLLASEV